MKTHSLRWYPPQGVTVKEQGVYLLHGTGEHAARYEHLAVRLSQLGYRVGAHDHPGHGRSEGTRGVVDPPGSLVTQAAIQCQRFAAETQSVPILFGHSLGGIAACELVLEHQLPVSGLILSAPAFAAFIGKRDRLKVRLLAHVAPTLTVERPYDATFLTHDQSIRDLAEADSLIHGVKSASLIHWLLSSGERQITRAASLDVDTLVLIAGDDRIVDSNRTREFTSNAPEHRMTVHYYDGLYHELLNETPDKAAQVFGDIERWLEERF